MSTPDTSEAAALGECFRSDVRAAPDTSEAAALGECFRSEVRALARERG